MSPRAAWRLETLGFSNVYDYEAGKADWFAAGLPRQGQLASIPRAADVARRDDIVCQLSDPIGAVIDKLRAAGKETCLVTTGRNVVLGRVRIGDLTGDKYVTVEEMMEPGPTTIRADTMLDAILKRLKVRNVESILVTTSDGRLVGTLYRSDVEARLNEGRVEKVEQRIDDESSCCCKD